LRAIAEAPLFFPKLLSTVADKSGMKPNVSVSRKVLFINLAIAVGAGSVIAADPPSAPVVTSEYAKQQVQLESQLAKAKRMLRDFEAVREKAISDSKAMAQTDMAGLKALKRYDTLMSSRYATEQGEFQPWRPLAKEDVENINRLFDTYLRSKPLFGRVSAGQAHKMLDWGMSRLEEMTKARNKPKPDNNSDLEIVAHQIKETEATLKSIMTAADKLGMKLNPNPNENEQEASVRVPASKGQDDESLSNKD
jgi:hypothetical protein